MKRTSARVIDGLWVAWALLVGCEAAQEPSSPSGPGGELNASSISLSQASGLELEVPRGTHITWRNDRPENHSVTSPKGLWDSGRLRPGEEFSIRFESPGEYVFASVFDLELSGVIRVTNN